MTEQQPTVTDVAARCFDLDMRVERITHLAVLGGDDMSRDIFEYLTSRCARTLAGALGVEDLDEHISEFGDEWTAQRESLAQSILWHPLRGFLVEASQPVFSKTASDHLVYTWAIFESRVFYGDTYDAALELAFQWATDRHNAALAAAPEQ